MTEKIVLTLCNFNNNCMRVHKAAFRLMSNILTQSILQFESITTYSFLVESISFHHLLNNPEHSSTWHLTYHTKYSSSAHNTLKNTIKNS